MPEPCTSKALIVQWLEMKLSCRMMLSVLPSVHNPLKFTLRKLRASTVRLNHSAALNVNVLESRLSSDVGVIFDRDHVVESSVGKQKLKRYSGLLHNFALTGFLNGGKAVHGQILTNKVNPDSRLWISLLNMYAKCGSLVIARILFDEMPDKNVVSWAILLDGFVRKGHARDSVNMFCDMRSGGLMPNEFTVATCLRACSMCSDKLVGKRIHGEIIKLSFVSDAYVISALVEFYAKCGEMECASSVFSSMEERNVVLWNVLLNGYAMVGDANKFMKLFCTMIEHEARLSKFTLCTALKCFTSAGKLKEAQIVHSLIIKVASEADNIVGCSLVDMYSKCGLAHDALKAFHPVKNPDVVTWTALITCLDQQGCGLDMSQLFNIMRRRGIEPNLFSLTSLLSTASSLRCLSYGKCAHALICKYGYVLDTTASNALVSMYMRNGCVKDGLQVFELMEEKDTLSWNALLLGFEDAISDNLPFCIFYRMLAADCKPNKSTFIYVLKSSSNFISGKQVHAHIVKSSLGNNTHVGTELINMYSRNGYLDEAEHVFKSLVNRDIVSWTSMISVLQQSNEVEKALKHFVLMQREGMKTNEFTLASCLCACSRIATLETGRLLHAMAIKAGQNEDSFVSSALIDMYGKCGCIEEAESIFQSLEYRDTALWNTAICLFPQYGLGLKSIETFQMMLDEGIMPDGITFVGLITACSHTGLISEGEKYFNSISKDFGIFTTMKHFACVVDMYGRAGRFNDAERFIQEMESPPNALIWETLLGACEMHGNLNVAKRAAERLFELEPEEARNYILLSNIFATKRCWSDVQKVRCLMTSRGIVKEKACSWVGVNGTTHVFASQDFSNPKLREIYAKLEELSQLLACRGYVAKTDYVLQDVPEMEKEKCLHHHSERLALAFALISTEIKKTIRIFKNNRICGDCHDVMRLTSDIANREIVVRDFRGFHHFKKGTCSCTQS